MYFMPTQVCPREYCQDFMWQKGTERKKGNTRVRMPVAVHFVATEQQHIAGHGTVNGGKSLWLKNDDRWQENIVILGQEYFYSELSINL